MLFPNRNLLPYPLIIRNTFRMGERPRSGRPGTPCQIRYSLSDIERFPAHIIDAHLGSPIRRDGRRFYQELLSMQHGNQAIRHRELAPT
jgi:hypothetical protein